MPQVASMKLAGLFVNDVTVPRVRYAPHGLRNSSNHLNPRKFAFADLINVFAADG